MTGETVKPQSMCNFVFAPRCGIDCVLPDAGTYELTPDLLTAMRKHYCSGA